MTIATAIGSAVDRIARSTTNELRSRIFKLAGSAIWIGDEIVRSVGQWVVDFLSNAVFQAMVFLNPRLSPLQRSQLLRILSREMANFVHQGALDEQLVKSLVALTAPDRKTYQLLTYLVESIDALAAGFDGRSGSTPNSSSRPSSVDAAAEERAAVAMMIKTYGIHRSTVSAMPPKVRQAIVRSLGIGKVIDRDRGVDLDRSCLPGKEKDCLVDRGDGNGCLRTGSMGVNGSAGKDPFFPGRTKQFDDENSSTTMSAANLSPGAANSSPPPYVLDDGDVRSSSSSTSGDGNGSRSEPDRGPICSITLEPLLWPDCTVTPDVLAVIQRSQHRDGGEHAFLYRGSALLEWLSRQNVPASPDTRSIIRPGDIYRLS